MRVGGLGSDKRNTPLFTIITSLKCKFVLHLLKEGGLNRSILVDLFVIFIPLSYFFEEYR